MQNRKYEKPEMSVTFFTESDNMTLTTSTGTLKLSSDSSSVNVIDTTSWHS